MKKTVYVGKRIFNAKSSGAEELFTPEDFHWQNVRERAAIAAMQTIIPTQKGEYMICDAHRRFEDCAETAVYYADALVEQLKKKQL